MAFSGVKHPQPPASHLLQHLPPLLHSVPLLPYQFLRPVPVFLLRTLKCLDAQRNQNLLLPFQPCCRLEDRVSPILVTLCPPHQSVLSSWLLLGKGKLVLQVASRVKAEVQRYPKSCNQKTQTLPFLRRRHRPLSASWKLF